MSRLPPNLRPPRRAVQLSKKTFEWHKKEMTSPPYGYLARLLRPFPDFDPPFIKPVRQKAHRGWGI